MTKPLGALSDARAKDPRTRGMDAYPSMGGSARPSDDPQIAGLNLAAAILCRCSCDPSGSLGGEPQLAGSPDMCGFSPSEALSETLYHSAPQVVPPSTAPRTPSRPPSERSIVNYCAELNLPLSGPPLREAEVWHLLPREGQNFEKVNLSLHANGYRIRPLDTTRPPISIAWSPFSLVQACRLHNVKADNALPWLRLFKVSVFHHGITYFFAAQGASADTERARWVADIARALRVLTQSLFIPFSLSTSSVLGAEWTTTRLLAGYILLCNNQDVALVYCELHAHRDCEAKFVAYKDDICDARIMCISIGVQTVVSERVGVDCSCFSVDGHHFSTRSAQEKTLWLRAISNVKVKLRHCAENPTHNELAHYRAAILESANNVRCPRDENPGCALLPRRACRPASSPGTTASAASPGSGASGYGGNELAEGRHRVPSIADSSPASTLKPSVNFTSPMGPDAYIHQERMAQAVGVVALGPPQSVPGTPAKNGETLGWLGASFGPTSKPPQIPLDWGVDDGGDRLQSPKSDGPASPASAFNASDGAPPGTSPRSSASAGAQDSREECWRGGNFNESGFEIL